MDTRRTLQVVLVAFVASSLAQNFQPPGGFQPDPNGFYSQRLGPQSQSEEQRDNLRAQQEFRKFNHSPKNRPPNLDQPDTRTFQPAQQFQQNTGFSQGVQSFPQAQPQPQAKVQTPLRKQQPRPDVRQQQLRQPIQLQPQEFQQPSVPTQQFVPATAQQVNKQYFDHPSQQSHEQPVEFVAPQRTVPDVSRTQTPHRQPFQQLQQSQFDAELNQKQAENAQYSFSSSVVDSINDQENVRQETRDGLNLKGLYSYSDGYFKRTVHYEADQNGYRVIKEEVDAIGDGPKEDPNGRAEVMSNVAGNNVEYFITSADISKRAQQSPAQSHHESQHGQQTFAITRGS